MPIRHQNLPEDITENIVKFIIINHERDLSCSWAKSAKISGDLYSDKYIYAPIEIKAFMSDGPSSFGPRKKFGVLYFLDMRAWLNDIFILWKVSLTSDSLEWKNMKMSKSQTFEDQCKEGRRPHINWNTLQPQLQLINKCEKIYEGTFDGIKNKHILIKYLLPSIHPSQVSETPLQISETPSTISETPSQISAQVFDDVIAKMETLAL